MWYISVLSFDPIQAQDIMLHATCYVSYVVPVKQYGLQIRRETLHTIYGILY